MKKETLEEAAINYSLNFIHQNEFAIEDFNAGAKWQQERSYSEEDVINIIYKIYDEMGIYITLEDLLIQFKKR